jgi:uncharacterized membrane protein
MVGMITAARVRRIGWLLMTVSATGVALASARYFSLNPATFIPPQVGTYLAHLGPLLLHVGGGVAALALGPWQFWGALRARRPWLHRLIGRVYLVAVLAAGAGGLMLAPLSIGGPLAHLGFTAMAVLVLSASALAYVSIIRGRIAAHRMWMIRSYAMIFSAVSFRLWLGMLGLTGLPFDQGYAVGSWAAWLINLLAAEVLIGALALRPRPRPATAIPASASPAAGPPA